MLHQRAKLFLLSIIPLLFLSSCQTGYHAAGHTGGYKDVDTDLPFFFATNFSGNGYTEDTRAYELAKLRCAEKAWRNGYFYFVEVASNTQINQTGSVNTANAFPLYGGGAFGVGTSTPIYAPASGVSILGFSKKPPQNQFKAGTEIFSTKDFINSMVEKYRAKIDISVTDPQRPISDFESHLYKNLQNNDRVVIKGELADKKVEIIDARRDQNEKVASVFQSGYTYPEFPYDTVEDSKEFLSKVAKLQNSNLVIISSNDLEGENLLRRNIGLSFGVKMEAGLGVSLEPNLIKDKIFQIRNITAPKSPFKLGDKILSINNVDTISVARTITEIYYDKKVGEKINVKVARNGEMESLEVTLVAFK